MKSKIFCIFLLLTNISFAEEVGSLIKIPTRCGDTVRDDTSKCAVKVDCQEEGERLSMMLIYTCAASSKQFKISVEGLRQRPPSALLTAHGLFITTPKSGDGLGFVNKRTMEESKVATPSKGAFFFFNHDQSLLELTDSQCGGKAMFIKGKCYQVKERKGLVSE